MPYEKFASCSGETPSASPVEDNLKALASLFPSVVHDGQVDVDALRQLCGETVVKEEELFGLHWKGKTEARRAALLPSLGALRPCREESKDWETTKNIYIEGDNLEVLKLLRKSYAGKVRVVYIDPPYNTGGDFIYPDDYRNSIGNYLEQTGQQGNYKSNAEMSGHYHTNWLNMMYPRLTVARDLLSADGLMFISIDYQELGNLIQIGDQIFGEAQRIGIFKRNKTSKAPTLSGKIRNKYEYLICYSKQGNPSLRGPDSYNGKAPLFNSGNKHVMRTIPSGKLLCNFSDRTMGKGKYGEGDKYVELLDELAVVNGKNANDVRIVGRFKWSQQTLDEYFSKGETLLFKTPTMQTLYYFIPDAQWIAPSDIIDKKECHVETNDEAHDALVELFGHLCVFDYPKPVSLLTYILGMVNSKDCLVLDFFAGSSTTAHAVMKLNGKDGGNRRYILVQLPEPIRPESVKEPAARKTAENACSLLDKGGKPHNICEIGKERIRRAGEKVKEEAGAAGRNLDVGFRVYKLESSNVKVWNPWPRDLVAAMNSYSEHLVEGRTDEDFLAEIMLKSGIDLVEDTEEREMGGHRVLRLGHGQYYACMDANLGADAEAVAMGIAAWHEEQKAFAGGGQQDMGTVFVLDKAFEANDAAKMNFVAILEQYGIGNIKAL